MTKNIYITRRIPANGIAILQSAGYSVDIGQSDEAPTKEQLLSALSKKEYDGVICFLTDTIDNDIFNVCSSAKIFAQYSVGFNNIDLKSAQERGVTITNTPGSSSRAVAEQSVALMLALTTRIVEGDTFMRQGKYKGWSPYLLNGTDLTGKIVGLWGCGAIGYEVASILRYGFNCTILYTDVNPNQSLEEKCGARKVDKEELLRTSDILSLHVPLLSSTVHLLNKETLGLMKKSAYIINTARGPVVDEVALVEALTHGVIAGAGLDVYEFEPQVAEGLLALPNVVLTPHIASARESVRQKMSEIVANNIVSFFEKGEALNPVSAE
jgi:glyoxylate reductase